jgi:class 3 adenylate cyclase
MSPKYQPPKRQRGVILSVQGWQRLNAAQRKLAFQDNRGKPYTLEQLSERTHLSPNTLIKVRRRTIPVDRKTLMSYFSAFDLTLNPNDYTKADSKLSDYEQVPLKSPVPLNSPFYIERLPIESLCHETLVKPGSSIQIVAPKQMGKTSLMTRILQQARAEGFYTILLNLQLAESSIVCDLNRFLQWFCAVVTRGLDLPHQVPTYWDDIYGGNANSTYYFETYLLPKLDNPLVLALDNADLLLNYPEIAQEFFRLLQSWGEKASYGDRCSQMWQNLRLVIANSTEIYAMSGVNCIEFTAELSIQLSELTEEQVQDLVIRHGFNLHPQQVKQLYQFLGGHPFLIQLTLNAIKTENISIDQFLATVTAEADIYREHLHQCLWHLHQDSELMSAFVQVVNSSTPVEFEPILTRRLQNLGLVQVDQGKVRLRCQLYHHYFRDRLKPLGLKFSPETRQVSMVVIEGVNLTTNLLAHPESTFNQLYKDLQLFVQLAQEFDGKIIKSIDQGMLIVFPSCLQAVNFAQEIQLTLQSVVQRDSNSKLCYRIGIHWEDVIFCYTGVSGLGVKIAHHLTAEAPPGGICISHSVYEAIANYLPQPPQPMGQWQFEDSEQPIALYQLK